MAAHASYARLLEVAKELAPRVALVLGSGWGKLADHCKTACALEYLEVPELAAPSIPGHGGSISIGLWGDRPLLLFCGRLHHYEGHAWRRVLQPMHIARLLGIETMILTNSAGGIRADLRPGTLMAIAGHLSWIGPEAWKTLSSAISLSPAAGEMGEGVRPDREIPGNRDDRGRQQSLCHVVTAPYCARLRGQLEAAAAAAGVPLTRGVYAQVSGPCYETPAEIGALRICGADAVGMSTAKESEAAHALGMRCLGISCITNAAAGLSEGPIHHGEVTLVAGERCDALGAVFAELFTRGF